MAEEMKIMKDWHFVSRTCEGVTCRCGRPAAHKIGEEIPGDDPHGYRHNFTRYVCCSCFREIMGAAVFCPISEEAQDEHSQPVPEG